MFKQLLRPIMILAFGLAAAGARADATPAEAPDVALRTTTEQIRGMIRDHYDQYKSNSAVFYQAVNDVVVPRFDVQGIARAVLGLDYRNATPDQRQRFATAFKDMLVHSYANALLDNYKSVKIDWMPPRMLNATDASVNTSLTRDNGQSYAIGFRVHVVDGDWKILDIVVENVSLVLSYRTQLGAEVKRTSLDDVISRMQNGQFQPDSSQQQAKAH
jgi:phospholipid transport system substrate-binding protein